MGISKLHKITHPDDQNECAICDLEMQTTDSRTLDCAHRFHKECIESWLNAHEREIHMEYGYSMVCPMCHLEVNIQEVSEPNGTLEDDNWFSDGNLGTSKWSTKRSTAEAIPEPTNSKTSLHGRGGEGGDEKIKEDPNCCDWRWIAFLAMLLSGAAALLFMLYLYPDWSSSEETEETASEGGPDEAPVAGSPFTVWQIRLTDCNISCAFDPGNATVGLLDSILRASFLDRFWRDLRPLLASNAWRLAVFAVTPGSAAVLVDFAVTDRNGTSLDSQLYNLSYAFGNNTILLANASISELGIVQDMPSPSAVWTDDIEFD